MSKSIVSYKNYVAGWLDSSIHDFLGEFAPDTVSTRYALITCLDSNLDPASLREKSPELKCFAGKAQPLGKGLLLPTDLLLQVDSGNRFFFGFDEVWFFPDREIEAKPEAAGLVGPARIDQARLDALGGWMSRSSCSLALADGEGLNFIVKARGVVKYLIGHSLQQPQLTTTAFEVADSA